MIWRTALLNIVIVQNAAAVRTLLLSEITMKVLLMAMYDDVDDDIGMFILPQFQECTKEGCLIHRQAGKQTN